MPRKRANAGQAVHDVALEHFKQGYAALQSHPLFAPLLVHTYILRREGNLCPKDGWAVVSNYGTIHIHPTRRGDAEEWQWVLAHCLLHLGFGHFQKRAQPREWNAACDGFVNRFLADLKLGRPPEGMGYVPTLPGNTEDRVYDLFCVRGTDEDFQGIGTAGPHTSDMIVETRSWESRVQWPDQLAAGLVQAVTSAVEVAAGRVPSLGASTRTTTPAQAARSWFISSYPLLGSLAATFTIIEDPSICQRLDISVAAVDPEAHEVYFNPAAFSANPVQAQSEYRFVMAHEFLHVGLRHDVRREGRDPYYWNVACFPAGTWIGDGAVIENIATTRRHYSGPLVDIDCQGGHTSCTPEHPFFARKRVGKSYPIKLGEPCWIEARDLQPHDYLLIPAIRNTVEDDHIDLRPYLREGTDSLGRHTFGNRAIKGLHLDEDLAWLIGLYVAEGNSSPHPCFTLSPDETNLADRVVTILRDAGYSASLHFEHRSLRIIVGGLLFGRWLKEHCGESAHSKHTPRIILNHANAGIRHAFLMGLMAGDGHSRKQTAANTTVAMIGSVSERLITDVALLLAQDGIGGSRGVMRRGPRKIGSKWTDKELILHTFRWNPEGTGMTSRTMNGRALVSYSCRWKADAHGVWYPIRAVRAHPFDGPVFNMTTPDHTYIANGFLVHNCDYVINAWLVEMGVGTLPGMGALHDPELTSASAESLYDRIVTDLRRFRKLRTMRGIGASDVLERDAADWWRSGAGVDLDAFYRRCLSQGLVYHQAQGRGTLPAGLIEEIEALSQPPIPWDVELARWFDHYFPPPERVHSYARPSRRQSATPALPRPRWVPAPDWDAGRTFGVVLDTSGSMDRKLLAKALGAIASYSLSREVPAVRVVFCDAATYDQGYMPPEAIAETVRVRGRGGTILQPGIDLLERAEDFPADGPLLIMTDGRCDKLQVRRAHAFLIPAGHALPFVPKGPVFHID